MQEFVQRGVQQPEATKSSRAGSTVVVVGGGCGIPSLATNPHAEIGASRFNLGRIRIAATIAGKDGSWRISIPLPREVVV